MHETAATGTIANIVGILILRKIRVKINRSHIIVLYSPGKAVQLLKAAGLPQSLIVWPSGSSSFSLPQGWRIIPCERSSPEDRVTFELVGRGKVRNGASAALVVAALAPMLRGQRGAILGAMTTRPGTCPGGAFACWHSSFVKTAATSRWTGDPPSSGPSSFAGPTADKTADKAGKGCIPIRRAPSIIA